MRAVLESMTKQRTKRKPYAHDALFNRSVEAMGERRDVAMRSHPSIHKWRRSITAAIGVGAVLSVTLVWPAPAAIAAAGSMAWVARYGTHKLETVRAVAVSPD